MNQMEEYYVVKRTKVKDEKIGEIEALSLRQAASAFKSWSHDNRDHVEDAEEIYIFSMKYLLQYDENGRIVKPHGEISTIINLK